MLRSKVSVFADLHREQSRRHPGEPGAAGGSRRTPPRRGGAARAERDAEPEGHRAQRGAAPADHKLQTVRAAHRRRAHARPRWRSPTATSRARGSRHRPGAARRASVGEPAAANPRQPVRSGFERAVRSRQTCRSRILSRTARSLVSSATAIRPTTACRCTSTTSPTVARSRSGASSCWRPSRRPAARASAWPGEGGVPGLAQPRAAHAAGGDRAGGRAEAPRDDAETRRRGIDGYRPHAQAQAHLVNDLRDMSQDGFPGSS